LQHFSRLHCSWHKAGKQLVARFAGGEIAVIIVHYVGRAGEMRRTSKREASVFGLSR